MTEFIDFFLHVDDHLRDLVMTYGSWVYAILFLIVFALWMMFKKETP